jgi:hypothetical protein
MSNLFNPSLANFQIPPPFVESYDFENFIEKFFNELEQTTSFQRFGVSGQRQNGIDVFSHEKGIAIQCKVKLLSRHPNILQRELIKDLLVDFKDFEKYNNKPGVKFKKFILASTFRNDTKIQEECRKLSSASMQVEYWSWNTLLQKCPPSIAKDYMPSFLDSIKIYYDSNSYLPILKEQNNFVINRSQPILKQLDTFIKNQYKELNFIPLHLIYNSYPFNIEGNKSLYYSMFSLETNNENLFNLFSSIEFTENGELMFNNNQFSEGITNYQVITKRILSKLTANLIFSINYDSGRKNINIANPSIKKCNCILCNLSRLELKKSFNLVSKSDKSIEDKFKKAFFHYQIGNYATSAKEFLEISKECGLKHLKIQYFIAQFNLSKLAILLQLSVIDSRLDDELSKIDIESDYQNSINPVNKAILNWIKDHKFYSNPRDIIQKKYREIIDQYYSQLNGGQSTNSHIWLLINQFAQLDTFINTNYIVFDHFNEFTETSDIFIESIIASHSIKNKRNSKLMVFDDWMINKLIFDGDSNQILKYKNKYKLKEIIYSPTSKTGDNLLEIISNFFSQSSELNTDIFNNLDFNGGEFWLRYNKILNNIFVVSGLCNLDEYNINTIVVKIIKFIQLGRINKRLDIKHLDFLIFQKKQFISEENLKNIFILIITNGHFHHSYYIQNMAEILRDRKIKIKLSKKDIAKLGNISFNKCPICQTYHKSNFIVWFYNLIEDQPSRNLIKNIIEDELVKNFNYNFYYEAAIEGIFDLSDQFFDQYLEVAKLIVSTFKPEIVMLITEEDRYPKIDNLINMCYKHNIDLKDEKFAEFKGLNPYYDWLFDLKGFNYNQFDPNWINIYPTSHYYREFRKHSLIKEKIEDYLKENRDERLERNFLNLFILN